MVASALLTPFAYAPYRLYWLMPILVAAMLVVAVKYQAYRLRMVYVWALIAYFVQCYWINTALARHRRSALLHLHSTHRPLACLFGLIPHLGHLAV
jgi:apolipoprotein N-acyltransferase